MRFLGALTVIGAFTAAAAEKNGRAKERIADLSLITEFIAHIGREIGYFSTPLPDVMRSFGKFGERRARFADLLVHDPDSAVSELSLCDDDKKLFREFFALLGKGYSDAEVRMCRSYGERFGARLEEEKNEYSRTAKVRSMTALLAGTALAILFI